ncbi:hypothetical protein CR513_15647, partial [Mucuna pruriens]
MSWSKVEENLVCRVNSGNSTKFWTNEWRNLFGMEISMPFAFYNRIYNIWDITHDTKDTLTDNPNYSMCSTRIESTLHLMQDCNRTFAWEVSSTICLRVSTSFAH